MADLLEQPGERPDRPVPPRGARSPAGKLLDSTRTEAFADGVFAITITLLVVEIPRPDLKPSQLFTALIGQWPLYVAFAISAIYVGAIWMNHHALFVRVHYVDRGLLWINFAILMTSALLPFPTAVLVDALAAGDLANQQVAVGLYALIAGLMSAAWIPIFPYLRDHPALLKDETDAAYLAAQWPRPWTGVILYTLAGLLGLLTPVVGILLFIVMVIYHIVTSEGVGENPFNRLFQQRGGASPRHDRQTDG